MTYYYFTTEAGIGGDEAAFIERTAHIGEEYDTGTPARMSTAHREHDAICKALDELGIEYHIASEDCYYGDIYLLGSTGKPLIEE